MQECLSGVLSGCYFLNLDVLLHYVQTFFRICGGPVFCVIIVIVNYDRLKKIDYNSKTTGWRFLKASFS